MKTMTAMVLTVAMMMLGGCAGEEEGPGCGRPEGPPEPAALCNTGPDCAACYSDGDAPRYYAAAGCGWSMQDIDPDAPSPADAAQMSACADQFDAIWGDE